MISPSQPDLLSVDWSLIPAPADDGAARHLTGALVPDIALAATDGSSVSLSRRAGRSVVFAFPRTGRPGAISPVADWDLIPGARGCTPQACAFRDLHAALAAAGADRVYGLSTQDSDYQREAVERLHLPFALLSDAEHALTDAARLPWFEAGGLRLLRRLALIIDGGRISHVFYPVFPPDRNADDVRRWLEENRRS